MRVTHFLNSMRPEHDGVTRVANRLREGFKVYSNRYGDQYDFIAGILPDTASSDLRKVASVPFPFSTGYSLPVCTADSIGQMIQEMGTEVIHIHTPCSLGISASRAGETLGIPTVATYHTHFPTYMAYYNSEMLIPWVWKYLKSLYRSCQSLIVPSKTTLLELQKEGFKNLIHIPHGVDTHDFSNQFRSEDWRTSVDGKDKVVVTFVGRLVWEKNLNFLAEAAELVESKNQIQWVIVGDGPARAKFEKMMPQAHFTGFLNEDRLPTAYASGDLFVFPSVTETFGNVTVEAMASGLPAICVAAGGARDIVTPESNGILTPIADPKSFARAIDRLVKQPELRLKLSKGALETAALYDWENTIKRYREVYKNAINNRKARPVRSKFSQIFSNRPDLHP
jgi:glycosyltransferase involved in cell wall biosynthesis